MKKPIALNLFLVVATPAATTAAAFTANHVLPLSRRTSSLSSDSWLQQKPPQHKSFHRHHKQPLYYSSASEISSLATSRSPYIRWKSSSPSGEEDSAAASSLWEMQTAVTSFEQRRQDHDENNNTGEILTTTQRVELHAQLHFGDEAYFDYYKTPEFNNNRIVLYELLLDEELLITTPYDSDDDDDDSNDDRTTTSNYRVLKRPSSSSNNDAPSPVVVTASVQDESTARQYGWACQVNALSEAYSTRPNWIHADLTRQEFLQKVATTAATTQEEQKKQSAKSNKDTTPLWQVAAAQQQQRQSPLFGMIPQSAAATEAATALLVGPPVLSPDVQGVRRLFSNLFLPGTALVQCLRALLWLTVPSPEISVLLLDWSSVVVDNDNKRGSKGGGLSPISWPLLQALGRGRLDQVRRLIFGQVVLQGATTQQQTSTSSSSSQDWNLLIQERNNHAMQVLRDTLRDDDNDDDSSRSKVLLYGCSHCTDLHDQIVQEGFQPVKKEWRTAWSVPVGMEKVQQTTSTKGNEEEDLLGSSPTALVSSSNSFMAIWILLPAYFAIGGLDWIATLQDMAQSADKADGLGVTADALLYLVRHVLLYLGLSKFVLDWGGTTAMATTTTSSTADTDDA